MSVSETQVQQNDEQAISSWLINGWTRADVGIWRALHKNCWCAPMWVEKSRTGSEAQRSDRVRIECHKQAEAT